MICLQQHEVFAGFRRVMWRLSSGISVLAEQGLAQPHRSCSLGKFLFKCFGFLSKPGCSTSKELPWNPNCRSDEGC